ncbi:MAG: DUF4105 domain-containing protein [Spirochaetota bacterium]
MKSLLFIIFIFFSAELLDASVIPDTVKIKWENSMSLSRIGHLKSAEEEFNEIDRMFKNGRDSEFFQKYPFKVYLYCQATNQEMPDYNSNPIYNEFFLKFNFSKISIIFVSPQIHIPASMFGHTFITFKSSNKSLLPLDTSIDFIGVTENERCVSLKSLLYHIPGKYHLKQFIDKFNEYDREHRDLWEYEMNVSKQLVFEMKLFAIEVSQQKYKYNFLFKNCSDYIYYFLRVWPELNIKKNFLLTIPLESVKIINNYQLINKASFYASHYTKAMVSYEALSNFEKEIFKKIKQRIDNGERFNDQYSANITACVSAYLNYKIKNEKNYYIRENSISLKKNYNLKLNEKFFLEQPLEAHSPFRIDFSYLIIPHNSNFYCVGLRPAIHSAHDPTQGYQKNTSIEVLSSKIMIKQGENTVKITDFSLISIDTFIPGNFLSNQFTRYLAIAYEDKSIISDKFFQKIYMKIGSGYSYKVMNHFNLSIGLHAGVVKYFNGNDSLSWVIGSRPRINISFNRFLIDAMTILEYDNKKDSNIEYIIDLGLIINKNCVTFFNYTHEQLLNQFKTGLRIYI